MISGRPETTAALSVLLEKTIDPHNDSRIYWAKEITFDHSTGHAIRVDYMRFKPLNNSVSGIEKGDFFCYGIKSSAEDFHSGHGHNFIGDYNYYVMPEAVYNEVKSHIPFHVGVLAESGGALKSVKRAWRQNRERPVSEMLFMMWRSSRRELVKARKAEEDTESGT